MENSRNNRCMSFKLRSVPSSVMKSPAVPLSTVSGCGRVLPARWSLSSGRGDQTDDRRSTTVPTFRSPSFYPVHIHVTVMTTYCYRCSRPLLVSCSFLPVPNLSVWQVCTYRKTHRIYGVQDSLCSQASPGGSREVRPTDNGEPSVLACRTLFVSDVASGSRTSRARPVLCNPSS